MTHEEDCFNFLRSSLSAMIAVSSIDRLTDRLLRGARGWLVSSATDQPPRPTGIPPWRGFIAHCASKAITSTQ